MLTALWSMAKRSTRASALPATQPVCLARPNLVMLLNGALVWVKVLMPWCKLRSRAREPWPHKAVATSMIWKLRVLWPTWPMRQAPTSQSHSLKPRKVKALSNTALHATKKGSFFWILFYALCICCGLRTKPKRCGSCSACASCTSQIPASMHWATCSMSCECTNPSTPSHSR